jgi:phosphatidate cytidylyltransferase
MWIKVTGLPAYLALAAACFVVYLIYLFTVAVFRRGKMAWGEVSTAFTGVLYIAAAFASLALLRHNTRNGEYLYLLVFFGAWVTDTFAYFTGRFFGKHKLNPEISPKKTVEGSIGGILFCILSFVGFGLVMQFAYGKQVNYIMLCVAGLICSFVSQIGDLITSLIKREHGVKDFGKIFPGHGGVLDRFDSVLAISPVLLILCNLVAVSDALGILL